MCYCHAEMSERRLALLVAAALLVAFAPAIVTPYAFTDDWPLLAQVLRGESLVSFAPPHLPGEPPALMISLARGCPTSAYLTYWAFAAAHSLENLRFLRLAGVVGLALLAYLLLRALTRVGWPAGRSAALALLICALPPFQVCVAWSLSFSVLYSCILAGLACHLTLRAAERPRWPDIAGALALLFLAVTIYQVTIMYFVMFAAIDLFRPDGSTERLGRRLVWLSGMLLGGLVLGFVAYKIGLSLYGEFLPPGRSTFTHDIPGKLDYFVRAPLHDALQFSKLWPVPYLPWIVGAFIGSGLFLYFNGPRRRRLLLLGLAAIMVPGIYLPNLLTAENWGAYRTQIGLASLLMFYAFLALHGWARTLGRPNAVDWILPFAATLACVAATHNLIRYYAEPQMTELSVMRAQLAGMNLAKVSKLNVIGSTWRSALNGVLRDEFGIPSSAQPWAQVPMVYSVVYEMLGGPPSFPIVAVPTPRGFKVPAGEALVDMSGLGRYATPEPPTTSRPR